MTTSIVKATPLTGDLTEGAAENAIVHGNLEQLSPADRVAYYGALCRSLGLNPMTRPFSYLKLSGKLTLYATRDATDQLRSIRGISITRLERDHRDGLASVTAHAVDKTGRTDAATGVVPTAGLRGEALANALMKAETKAKRRVTLSLAGAGFLDETEVQSIPDARTVVVDHQTGEIVDADEPFDGAAELAAVVRELGADRREAWRVSGLKKSDLGVPERVAEGICLVRAWHEAMGAPEEPEAGVLDGAWEKSGAVGAPGVDPDQVS